MNATHDFDESLAHPLYYVTGNLQLRIIDLLDADLPGALVDDYSVLRHRLSFEFAVR